MSKELYVPVSGSNRKVKSILVPVNGVYRKVKIGYAPVGGANRQFYSSGTPISSLSVGSIVNVYYHGALRPFIIVQIGNPDNSIYGSGCDGVWLIDKYVIYQEHGRQQMMNDDSDAYYNQSSLHSFLNSTYFNDLGSGARQTMSEVNIPYISNVTQNGKYGIATISNMNTKVFILSATELGSIMDSSRDNYFPLGKKMSYFGAGTWLGYFGDNTAAMCPGGTSTADYRSYWTRSMARPTYYDSWGSNYTQPRNLATDYCDVRPCFVVPMETTLETLQTP